MSITRRQFIQGAAGVAVLASPRMAQAADPDFSIVCLPDMQYMADSGQCPNAATGSKLYYAVMNSIIADAASLNIKAVLSLGDCANVVAVVSKNAQDTIVEGGYNLLSSNGVAYVTCLGNHDYLSVPDRTAGYLWTNSSGLFHPTQQIARFGSGISMGAGDTAYWGGSMSPTSGVATYALLDIGSWHLLILSLPFYPDSPTLAWAHTVMTSYHDRTVIIITHGFLDATGTLFGRSGYGPDGFSLGASPDSNCGTQMWGTLASDGGFTQLKYEQNLAMVCSGHDIANGDSSSYYYRRLALTSSSVRGHTCQSMFCNLQQVDLAAACGGSPPDGTANVGHLKYLYFSPSAGTCTVKVRSVNSGNYLQPRLTTGWTGTDTAVDSFSFAALAPIRRIFPMPGASQRSA